MSHPIEDMACGLSLGLAALGAVVVLVALFSPRKREDAPNGADTPLPPGFGCRTGKCDARRVEEMNRLLAKLPPVLRAKFTDQPPPGRLSKMERIAGRRLPVPPEPPSPPPPPPQKFTRGFPSRPPRFGG